MSNLQTLKGVYEAFAKGDVPSVRASMDDQINWEEPESLPYESQVGPDAVLQNIFGRVFQDVAGFTVTPEEFVDGGDVIVSLGRYRGTGTKTGKALDTRFVHVWRFKNGKLSYFRTYTDTKHWLDAVGA